MDLAPDNQDNVIDATLRFALRTAQPPGPPVDTFFFDCRPHFHLRRLRGLIMRGRANKLSMRRLTDHYLNASEKLKPPVITVRFWTGPKPGPKPGPGKPAA